MRVCVRAIHCLADGINGYELAAPDGGDLPSFAAGAHIDVRIDGLIRQYSLCNDPIERQRYYIAVLKEIGSRGGSKYLHDLVRPGDLLEVSAPRNNFPLTASAAKHLLVAGGIGVTPMMAMVAELKRRGADFRLYYCTRSLRKTAFAEELSPLVHAGRVVIHHDDGDPARSLDLVATLQDWSPGTHLYYCGPARFMATVSDAARAWPTAVVHCEYFTASTDGRREPAAQKHPFRIKIASTGAEYEVPPEQSIVEVLRRHGVAVDTSCEDGYCGTCMTPYVAGEPEHHDHLLDAESRKKYVLICCARSKTPVLELDL